MSAYSAAPPLVRVRSVDGGNVVLNMNHVAAVDTNAQDQDHANVRFSTGAFIAIAMTVDDFWDLV